MLSRFFSQIKCKIVECWPQYHFRGISVEHKHFSSKWLSDRIWKLGNEKNIIGFLHFHLKKRRGLDMKYLFEYVKDT